jgi:hypothetical protein
MKKKSEPLTSTAKSKKETLVNETRTLAGGCVTKVGKPSELNVDSNLLVAMQLKSMINKGTISGDYKNIKAFIDKYYDATKAKLIKKVDLSKVKITDDLKTLSVKFKVLKYKCTDNKFNDWIKKLF